MAAGMIVALEIKMDRRRISHDRQEHHEKAAKRHKEKVQIRIALTALAFSYGSDAS